VYFAYGSTAALWLERVGMVASPTFMLISGVMLGFLAQASEGRFDRLQQKLIDRGLFLLLVGHVLIGVSQVNPGLDLWSALCRVNITDVAGVGLLVGATVVPRTTVRQRLGAAAAIYLVYLVATAVWKPTTPVGSLFSDLLIGAQPLTQLTFTFALVPWMAWYLAGTTVGTCLGRFRAAGQGAVAGRWMIRLGTVAVVAAVAVKATYHLAKTGGLIAPNEILFQQTYLWGKYPPSIGYFLLFGGLGTLGFGALWVAENAGRWRTAIDRLAVVGRASWVVFLVQAAVYSALQYGVRPPRSMWAAPLYFAASLAVPLVVAHWWSARDLNRLLTVGYGRRRPAPQRAPALAPPGAPGGYVPVPASVAIYPTPHRQQVAVGE
jgi:hypothetical protein